MILEKPLVEFVALDHIDTSETSHSGVETCKGPTSYGRNCSHYNMMMDDCGTYVQGELDANYDPDA